VPFLEGCKPTHNRCRFTSPIRIDALPLVHVRCSRRLDRRCCATPLTRTPEIIARNFDHIPTHMNTFRRWEVQEIIRIGRHTKITAGGRIMSFSALVVIGDTRGTGSFTIDFQITFICFSLRSSLIRFSTFFSFYFGGFFCVIVCVVFVCCYCCCCCERDLSKQYRFKYIFVIIFFNVF
jgi:hypothetical protein